MQNCLDSSKELKAYLYRERLIVYGRSTDSQKTTVSIDDDDGQ